MYSIQTKRAKRPVALCVLLVLTMILTSFIVLQAEHVTVIEDGQPVAAFLTTDTETDAWLARAGVTLSAQDQVSVTSHDHAHTVRVVRAFPVLIHCESVNVTVMTTPVTVAAALAQANVHYSDDVLITPDLETVVTADTVINVKDTVTEYVTETQPISYETVTRKTDALYVGESKLAQKGADGEKTVTYRLVYRGGELISREPERTEITKQAQDEIILEGSKKKEVTTAQGKKEFTKVLNVTATAYSGEKTSGKVTCLGNVPERGTVAVDPDVIPLGTKMYIASADGSYVYGICTAGDTGSSIQGRRVDLFMDTERECYAFGRRNLVVYILK